MTQHFKSSAQKTDVYSALTNNCATQTAHFFNPPELRFRCVVASSPIQGCRVLQPLQPPPPHAEDFITQKKPHLSVGNDEEKWLALAHHVAASMNWRSCSQAKLQNFLASEDCWVLPTALPMHTGVILLNLPHNGNWDVLFFGVTAVPFQSVYDTGAKGWRSTHELAVGMDPNVFRMTVQEGLGLQILWVCPDWCFKKWVEERSWWDEQDRMTRVQYAMSLALPAVDRLSKLQLQELSGLTEPPPEAKILATYNLSVEGWLQENLREIIGNPTIESIPTLASFFQNFAYNLRTSALFSGRSPASLLAGPTLFAASAVYGSPELRRETSQRAEDAKDGLRRAGTTVRESVSHAGERSLEVARGSASALATRLSQARDSAREKTVSLKNRIRQLRDRQSPATSADKSTETSADVSTETSVDEESTEENSDDSESTVNSESDSQSSESAESSFPVIQQTNLQAPSEHFQELH